MMHAPAALLLKACLAALQRTVPLRGAVRALHGRAIEPGIVHHYALCTVDRKWVLACLRRPPKVALLA